MVLYSSPIFGPVSSRRLGISLGINLLPADGKCCSFDCLYCECGLNAERHATKGLPTCEEVAESLQRKLESMQALGQRPDVLTFAGNGEPTLHPQFPRIVDRVRGLRDRYFPEAKLSVLSNGTQVGRKEVLEALCRTDNPIIKLDTVDEQYIRLLDRPQCHYDVQRIVETLATVGRKIVIQTMFLGGTLEGRSVDNTGDEYVEPWLEALRTISPRQVMIYTIARETPVASLRKTEPRVLDGIASRVRRQGLECSVGY
ncbi:MAG: radical SAM protein [Prevotellaceae bacterium]|nr:radical SAM protein [Prevotellaceae bacterium]